LGYSEAIKKKVAARKRQIGHLLDTPRFRAYPREAVREVLAFWKIDLNA
jgi:hypothetical protein